MFSYHGSKSRIVKYYPKPQYDSIIEPFAGSARYSLRYFDRDVTLIDKYDVIIGIWKYLQQCSVKDIMQLPEIKVGETIRRNEFDCIEQAWLMGYLIQNGVCTPMLTMSKWGSKVFSHQRKFIADNLFKIRHWNIIHGDYKDADNTKYQTWFIDPPYDNLGHKYRHNNKKIDYSELSEYCKSRKGQVIVCEDISAKWLPFVPIRKQRGNMKTSCEAIWCNTATSYNSIQQDLFPRALI